MHLSGSINSRSHVWLHASWSSIRHQDDGIIYFQSIFLFFSLRVMHLHQAWQCSAVNRNWSGFESGCAQAYPYSISHYWWFFTRAAAIDCWSSEWQWESSIAGAFFIANLRDLLILLITCTKLLIQRYSFCKHPCNMLSPQWWLYRLCRQSKSFMSTFLALTYQL